MKIVHEKIVLPVIFWQVRKLFNIIYIWYDFVNITFDKFQTI